ncbi:hypothetical protein [Sphingobacterium sp.]|uniref:hypothetical protein n=1 Tax=Sphingobacterium sp. TaxID=341027 RepID=UPI00289B7A22|nr:hypothetical protein [Sphingobacterium sp.]
MKDPQSGLSYYFSKSVSSFTHVMAFFRGKFSTVFNESCSPMEDPLGIFGGRYRVVTSWKLDSVVSAANEKISYVYERFIYPQNYNMDTTAYQILETYVNTSFPGRNDTVKSGSIDPFWRFPDSVDLVKEIIYPYKGARLIFNYEKTTPRFEFWSQTNGGTVNSVNGIYYYSRLNTIEAVEQGQSNLYKLDYTYFHTPNGSLTQTESNAHLGDADDMYSLKLKTLSVRDRWTGNFQVLYRFGYNDNKARRFAKGLDYHGYFKGNASAATQTGHSIYGLRNREPDSTFMQYGILNSITSGTGAKVSFAYSIHKLSSLSNAMTNSPNWVGNTMITPPGQPGYVIGDGLKLNRVTIEDINDTETRTFINYTYGDGQYFMPGGIYTLPTYFENSSSDVVKGRHIYESFMNPGYFHNGSNHAYSMVTVKSSNLHGQQLSLKEYQLTNFSDQLSNKNFVAGGGQASVDFPFTRKQYMRTWEMGLPLKIRTHDNKDLVTEEQYFTYQFVIDTVSSLLAKVNDTNRVVSNVVIGPVLFHEDNTPCANIKSYKLTLDPYRPYKGLSLLKKVETRNYLSNSEFLTDIITYDYDARNNIKSARSQNIRGEYTENYSVYNYDIPATGDPALLKMQQEGSEYLVATEKWNNGPANSGLRNTNSRLLKGSVFKYKLENGGIYNEKVMETALDAPLAYSSYMSGGSGNVSGAVMAAYSGAALPAYLRPITDVKLRDGRGNPLETYLPAGDVYKAMIWDTLSGHKLADVVGARYSNIAYSGFEYGYGHNLRASSAFILHIDDNGSLLLPPNFTEFIPVSTTLSGNYFCLLKSGTSATKRLYTEGLEPGITYRATFWSSANTMPEFGIEGGTQFSLTEIAVKGQYKQYEVIFSPTVASQKIGLNAPGANIAIDELRIHPVEAQMVTYTYQRLNGKTSETDALGRITFYEYDGMGRLHLVRDQEGNIIQKQTYSLQSSY